MLDRLENNGRRIYSDGAAEFPSVTTLMGLPSHPWMMNWAQKLTAEAAVDVMPTLEGVPKSEKLSTIKAEAFARRNSAAVYGTEVHQNVEYLLTGEQHKLTTKPDVLGDAQAALDFLNNQGLTSLAVERAVANFAVGYAGTLDCLAAGDADGSRWIVDWKTGKIKPQSFYQCMAYAAADHIWSEQQHKWVPYDFSQHLAGVVVVQLKNQTWKAYPYPVEEWGLNERPSMDDVLQYLSYLVCVYEGEKQMSEFAPLAEIVPSIS